MKGLIRQAALGTCLGAAFTVLTGCVPEYRELVDPCWPERYNHQARHSIRATFNAQAANGHMLDQTVWNEHFDAGTAKLNASGKEHLKYLARREPAPDPMVFVQWSWDARGKAEELNNDRRAAVSEYLAQAAAARKLTVAFDVSVRDAAAPGVPSPAAPNLYRVPASIADQRQVDLDKTKAGAQQQNVNQSTDNRPKQ